MIHIRLPWLPPSVNELYIPVIKGSGLKRITIQVLSAPGRKFKKEAIAHLVQHCQPQMRWFKQNGTYAMLAVFGVQNLENKGWPKTAKARYKRADVTNRMKVLEDVIAEASAVDDSAYMISTCQKRVSETAVTDVWVWNLDEEGCPLDAFARSLF